jgi:hypothetical protein
MDEETKRKNVLDLQFQKYLSIASTSIILSFTYFLGVGIALVTKQIVLDNFFTAGALFVISAGVLGICVSLFFNAVYHLRTIPKVVKDL